MKRFLLVAVVALQACAVTTPSPYFDDRGREDVMSGGARLIPITTPKGVLHGQETARLHPLMTWRP